MRPRKPAYVRRQEKADADWEKSQQRADRHEIILGLRRIAEDTKDRFHYQAKLLDLERRRFWLDVCATAGLWALAAVGLLAIWATIR